MLTRWFWPTILLLALAQIGLVLISEDPLSAAVGSPIAWVAGVYIGYYARERSLRREIEQFG